MALTNCKECKGKISSEADSCPHCGCNDPIRVIPKCKACGGEVDSADEHCPKCGHPKVSSGDRGSLIKCRKCGNKTSSVAKCCPKCNCPDPVIEPLPFVKCRENDCGSIIHKEAKHCPNCGCKTPAPRAASTPKFGDYANADFLVKRKGTIYGPFKTNDLFDKIKNCEMLPRLEITINGAAEFQVWRPAYHYLPFSCYEEFEDERIIERNAKQDLLLGIAPVMLLSGIGLVYFLVTTIFHRAEAQSLEIDQSYNFFKIIGAVFALGLAIYFYRSRNKATAYVLIVWYLAGIILGIYTELPSFIMALIAIAGLLYSLRVIGRLERVQRLKVIEFINGDTARWFEETIRQEDTAKTQFNLARIYEVGNAVKQNHEEAVKWYRIAAEQNHSEAQFNLGKMYQKGLGVKIDEEEAIKWYQMAADQGHEDARNALKEISEQQKPKK